MQSRPGAALRRKSRRKGIKTAIFAAARNLANLVYRMMCWGQGYVGEGEPIYEERHRHRTLAYLERTAKELGHQLVPARSSPLTSDDSPLAT